MSEYCLRWNNHRPNLVTVFSELLTSEALVDVTLATDGHYIHAHKLVLSACSVYFKDLFGANPCKHPIVILKDIRIDDLKTVIDFIYRGEVNVSQDRLQDVLRTAESLRIKGLAENPRSYDEMSSHGARFSSSSLGSQVTRQRSSLTDSREQSLSLEGDEEAEPGTPPSSKRRKITASHDSSESLHGEHEETENEDRGRSCEVKDEPLDEHENEKPQTRDVEQESNVNRVADAMLMLQGASQDTGEESNTTPGTSSDSTLTSTHSQGAVGVVGLLPPQPSASQQHYMYPNSAYPKLQAANGSTITIRNGTPESFLRAIDEVREGRMGFCKAGRLYGVSHATLQKYYKAMGYSLRNQTHNPNFRKRPEGFPVVPQQRYYSLPPAQSDKHYPFGNSFVLPHIIVKSSNSSRSQMQDGTFAGVRSQAVTSVSTHAGVQVQPVSNISVHGGVQAHPVSNVSAHTGAQVQPISNMSTHAGVQAQSVSNVSTHAGVQAQPVSNVSTHAGVQAQPVSNVSTHIGAQVPSISNISTHAGVHVQPVSNVSTHAGAQAQPVSNVSTHAGVQAQPVSNMSTHAGAQAQPVSNMSTHAGVQAQPVSIMSTHAGVQAQPINNMSTHAGVQAQPLSNVSTHAGVQAHPVSTMSEQQQHEAKMGNSICDPTQHLLGSHRRLQPHTQQPHVAASQTFQDPCSTPHYPLNDNS
ncbi:broad-complex core protein isoforms 1/2/3/4/5-like isoform X5 [Homarus americanus]|nr:broad-complex core protein isoforms 1/2/3/4/5-like isoform X5 [Homarus americanus]XP_042232853.1 broad-complex core protein isoforms 1/2/3/4/5-like isoform X5 [Homarus americanus]XP_042232860.1 broad-complex core protein isoforms 1/2/3/4/5-like isoform X5 [Homarus americanus]XP_042232864.1 broad-complex core protein isoforms 1/2/3/4/5-like isoform X5 [Homarus americanus]XP_042232866.1 broad-complex core protein isoforms 1/2/3/4/5-like isoform X5 [Homarus americanus]XP_042232875.1 broad-comp